MTGRGSRPFSSTGGRPTSACCCARAMIGTVALKDGRFVAELESPDAPSRPAERALSAPPLRRGTGRRTLRGGSRKGRRSRALAKWRRCARDGRLVATGLDGFAEGWFAQGVMTWTSGVAGRPGKAG